MYITATNQTVISMMKLFKLIDEEIVEVCQEYYCFVLRGLRQWVR